MNCPRCGESVVGVDARGPDAHAFDPCGCPTGFATARELVDDTEPQLATDGGLIADDVLGACDICEENQGVSSEDAVNEDTGEMTTAWLCSECLDRLERYNRGDDTAFEDVVSEAGTEADAE